MEDPPRPPRRPRYSGKNPRHFSQKYKEHQQDPETLAKVTAAGKTPAGTHRPIMPAEVLTALALQPGDTIVDGTLGYGGHTALFLPAVQPHGRVIGLDVDPIQLPLTTARLHTTGWAEPHFTPIHSNFAGLTRVLTTLGLPTGVHALFCDLGVSSMQIDDPTRGFTWKQNGPLDMRLNPTRGTSVAELLRTIRPEKLARLIEENADEPLAPTLARALAGRTFTHTQPLADAITAIATPAHRLRVGAAEEITLTVRRVFQALRIAVNDEFSALDTLLRALPTTIRPGGRVAILTFHSGEDRRVKHAFRTLAATGTWHLPEDTQPLRPSPAEQHANPRSTSARLRHITRSVTAD